VDHEPYLKYVSQFADQDEVCLYYFFVLQPIILTRGNRFLIVLDSQPYGLRIQRRLKVSVLLVSALLAALAISYSALMEWVICRLANGEQLISLGLC
jgi:hypothetical protein